MRALSIRHPYAELILRGEKTIEYRSRPTKLIGERFYIYAAKKWAGVHVRHSRAPQNGNPECPASIPRSLDSRLRGNDGEWPTGVIVGTAEITRCVKDNGHYEWHLSNVKRIANPRPPTRRPQPVWFNPF